jgi:uncharacterized protein YbcI
MRPPEDTPGGNEPAARSLISTTDLEQTAAFLADQYELNYEAHPVDPRASLSGDVLTFAFAGGLSRADEWLLGSGREREMLDFREHFLRVLSAQFEAVVRVLTGAAVVSYFSAFETKSQTTSCYFVLRRDESETDEQRQAIRAWSEQVRRNARDLRERHIETREAHSRLRDLLHDLREDSESNHG